MNTELLATVEASMMWFSQNSTEKSRKLYFERNKLGDAGTGAVYVYFRSGKAVYIGESSRSIKRRMHDKTSPHKKKIWWQSWDSVQFVNIQNKTDRLTLEILLILGLEPAENLKPKARNVNEMFKT